RKRRMCHSVPQEELRWADKPTRMRVRPTVLVALLLSCVAHSAESVQAGSTLLTPQNGSSSKTQFGFFCKFSQGSRSTVQRCSVNKKTNDLTRSLLLGFLSLIMGLPVFGQSPVTVPPPVNAGPVI